MSSRPALADHLLSLSAPRAAARLMPSVVAARATQDFAVPASHVRLVDSAATASDFTAAMERLLLRRSTVGFDAEWRPDAHGVRSEPSLLQLAEETGDVWLLDVASTPAPPLAALHSVMASDAVRVLGFGFAADFERCRFPVARRVVDLRDACASASASGTARGLAAELAQHAGLRLDKTEQCSDWQRRPLSAAQIAYAAADAACLHRLDAALDATAARDEREYRAAAAEASSATVAAGDSAAGSSADAADAEETLRRVREAAARTPGATVVEVGAVPAGAVEVNALCVLLEGAASLVLAPAAERVNLRWLALVLRGRARRGQKRRRGVKLAPADGCASMFGAAPGLVPPCALLGAPVLALPSLADAPLAYASAGHPGWRLLLADPARALPLLAAAANGADAEAAAAAAPADAAPIALADAAADVAAGAPSSSGGFAWLPDPRPFAASLDDALDAQRAPPTVRLLLDAELAVLSRKLRMCGVDAAVAGEVVRTPRDGDGDGAADDGDGAPLNHKWKKKLTSLARVGVDTSRVEGDHRAAALDGRLLVTPRVRHDGLPAPYYALLADDADAQFGEVLEVLGLRAAVDAGALQPLRCGICNGAAWSTLAPAEVEGRVPRQILKSEDEFYECGKCGQLFWMGEKYERTMGELKRRDGGGPRAEYSY